MIFAEITEPNEAAGDTNACEPGGTDEQVIGRQIAPRPVPALLSREAIFGQFLAMAFLGQPGISPFFANSWVTSLSIDTNHDYGKYSGYFNQGKPWKIYRVRF